MALYTLDFADVLERNPYLVIFGTHCDVRAKGAFLRQPFDDLARGHVNDGHLRSKAGTHKGVLPIWTEHGHAWAICHLDATDFLDQFRIDNRDVVFATHRHPEFAPVGSEERFVRRPTDVHLPLYFVGGSIDERHRVRTNGNNGQRPRIWRIPQPMDEKLAPIERAERARNRIAESNHDFV